MYVVGSIAAPGGWDASKAVWLLSSGYHEHFAPGLDDCWNVADADATDATFNEIIPRSTSFEYKDVKKDGSDNVT
ncbi:hypothetical protein [Streptomyces sp. NPDC001851]|uniref:hypothetical protein n=1 Tax=Streptomyces sp. NPDC001851 TaxID=3154529 RepID=UPI00332EF061